MSPRTAAARAVTAELSADGRMVRHSCGSWGVTFPVADLDRWLAMYRGLQRRRHPRGLAPDDGRFGARYAADVAVLEAVQRDLEGRRDGR